MTITAYKLLKIGGAGKGSGKSSTNSSRAFEAVYQLTSNDPLDGPNVAMNYFQATAGLPWYGSPYQVGNDQYAAAECVSIVPSRAGMSNFINVMVGWEEPGASSGGSSEADAVGIDLSRKPPLQRHDQIETNSTYITIPAYAATFRGYEKADGTSASVNNSWLNTTTGYRGPIVNSALDAFDPPPEGEVAIDILRITRNVWPWNDALAQTYRNTVNNAAVTISKPDYGYERIIQPFTGRIIDISGSFEIDLEYKQKYWRTTIEVHINPLGWRMTMIDKGLRRRAKSGDETDTGVTLSSSTISTTGPQLTHIKDAAGNPITTPVLFDGNGKPLIAGFNPILMKWEWHTEITWEGIPW